MAGYALPAAWEEEQVVASCRTGGSDSLDLLYRQYAPALIAFCRNRLGGNGDAEDAAHEAILKAHLALPRFREGAPLWPWLSTIAANVCTDIQRTRNRFEQEGDVAGGEGADDSARSDAPELDEAVTRRVRAAIVSTALEELPDRFRKPLVMRELMGLSYDEIAAASNKSVGSVRTTLMRARRVFRARVEDVARRQGQWPLPAAAVGGLRKTREMVRHWRHAISRSSGEVMNALCRAEGALQAGLQLAAVAMVAAGTVIAGAGHGARGTASTAASAPIEHAAAISHSASVAVGPASAHLAVQTSGVQTTRGAHTSLPARKSFTAHAAASTPIGGDPSVGLGTDGKTLNGKVVTSSDNNGVGFTDIDCRVDTLDGTGQSGAACPAFYTALSHLPSN